MKQLILSGKDIFEKLAYILNQKQRKYCIMVFVLTVFGAVLETIGVSVILPFVQAMMFPEQLMESTLVSFFAHLFRIKSPTQLIVLVASGVVLVYLFKNIYMIALSYVRTKFAGAIKRDLSVYMMQSYIRRGYSYFLSANVSELQRGVSGDIDGVYNLLYNIFRLMAELFTVIAIGFYIIATDIVMSLVMLSIAGISVLITVLMCKKKMKQLGERFRYYDAETRKYSYQTFEGIKEVMVMNKQDYFTQSYEHAVKLRQKTIVIQTVVAESPTYIFEAICVIAMILAVCFRMFQGSDNSEFIPNVAMIVVAAFRLMPSMGRLTNNANNIMFNIPAMNATYENIKEANENKRSLDRDIREGGKSQKVRFREKIVLSGISWKYEEAEKSVINNLNLTIDKGDSIAFIGESGTGKSTISDIVMGLLIPQKGAVYMDGIDIRTIPQSWCKSIGYVPQSVYILDDSIRKNVAFGILDEEINDAMVWDALEQAQMKTFVEQLPKGLDTVLGDRGIRFSGGQRQRVAIARALYYNPDIMILDEATSALDNKTEEAIMEAIDYLQGKKTLIIVAHRLSTVRKCSHIYEIKDGKAIERKKEEIFS